MIFPTLPLIILGAFIGAASGYLGSFMVLKRMSLVGDALSHVALPGMAVALLWHLNPMLGAFVALTIAVVGIWYVQQNSTIYPDALVGVFFTASLAIGILITPQPELLEALFGNIVTVSSFDMAIAILVSALLLIVTYLISKRLTLSILSDELAKTTGVSAKTVNLIYYLLVGTVVALGVKFVGTLLTGALVIVPAASAKNFTRSLWGYSLWSIIFGVFSSIFGVLLAGSLSLSPGPIVVLVSIFIFLLTFMFKAASSSTI